VYLLDFPVAVLATEDQVVAVADVRSGRRKVGEAEHVPGGVFGQPTARRMGAAPM